MTVRANIETDAQEEAANAADDYLAWRDAKVRKALEDAKANPKNRLTQSEVWQKFGLES